VGSFWKNCIDMCEKANVDFLNVNLIKEKSEEKNIFKSHIFSIHNKNHTNLEKNAYIPSFYLHSEKSILRPNFTRDIAIWWRDFADLKFPLDSSDKFITTRVIFNNINVHIFNYDDYSKHNKLWDFKDKKIIDLLLT
jgi:hypothetical protein